MLSLLGCLSASPLAQSWHTVPILPVALLMLTSTTAEHVPLHSSTPNASQLWCWQSCTFLPSLLALPRDGGNSSCSEASRRIRDRKISPEAKAGQSEKPACPGGLWWERS